MRRYQSGMATIAFAVLIMSALGLLALGLVKAQWLGEIASGSQKAYSLRFADEETAMAKAHADLNSQELRKTLFDNNCPNSTSNGKTSEGNKVQLNWSSNCTGGDRSSVNLSSLVNNTGQPIRIKNLEILDVLLTDIPPAPVVSGGSIQVTAYSTVGNQNGVYGAMASGAVQIAKDASQRCAAVICQVIQNAPHFSGDLTTLYLDALNRAEIQQYASSAAPVPGMGLFHWIDGDLSLADGEYGTASSPLLLVVNGTLNLSRRTIIHGVVLVIGGAPVTINGGTIDGLLAASGDILLTDSATAIFSNGIIQAVRNTVGPYVEVQGSWRDF